MKGIKIISIVAILFWIGSDLLHIRTIEMEKEYYDDYVSREIDIVKATTMSNITILMNYLKIYSDNRRFMGMLMDLEHENPENIDSLLKKYAKRSDNLERPLDIAPNDYSFNKLYAFDGTGQTAEFEKLVNFDKLVSGGMYQGTGTMSDCLSGNEIMKSVVEDSVYFVGKDCWLWGAEVSVNGEKSNSPGAISNHFTIPKTNQLDIRLEVAFLSNGGMEIDTVRKQKTIYLGR